MIFTAEQTRLILVGRKTMTHRPVQEPRDLKRKNGTEYRSRPFGEHKIGAAIPLQRPCRLEDGQVVIATVARIVIETVEHRLLGDVTFDDARRAGFRTTDEFKAAWVRAHRDMLTRNEATRRDGIVCEPLDAEWLAARFDVRFAGKPVWAITFQLDAEHRPRLLAEAFRGDDHGYTDNPALALLGEREEAVDDDTLKEYAKEAHSRHHVRRGWLDQQLLNEAGALEDRLRRVRLLAKTRGIDVRNDMRVIEARIAAMTRKATRQEAA